MIPKPNLITARCRVCDISVYTPISTKDLIPSQAYCESQHAAKGFCELRLVKRRTKLDSRLRRAWSLSESLGLWVLWEILGNTLWDMKKQGNWLLNLPNDNPRHDSDSTAHTLTLRHNLRSEQWTNSRNRISLLGMMSLSSLMILNDCEWCWWLRMILDDILDLVGTRFVLSKRV